MRTLSVGVPNQCPTVLREEALTYPDENGARCFGSMDRVSPEKAIAANASAVREWDSNGTNFGFNPKLGHTAGEFGHNDFYAVLSLINLRIFCALAGICLKANEGPIV